MPGQQELPSYSWGKPFWLLLSPLDINKQNKVQNGKDGGLHSYFPIPSEAPVSCKTGKVSVTMEEVLESRVAM